MANKNSKHIKNNKKRKNHNKNHGKMAFIMVLFLIIILVIILNTQNNSTISKNTEIQIILNNINITENLKKDIIPSYLVPL